MEGAEALVLLTEWNEFMRLDLGKVKKLLKNPLVIDLRNIYKREEMKPGRAYLCFHRPPDRMIFCLFIRNRCRFIA